MLALLVRLSDLPCLFQCQGQWRSSSFCDPLFAMTFALIREWGNTFSAFKGVINIIDLSRMNFSPGHHRNRLPKAQVESCKR